MGVEMKREENLIPGYHQLTDAEGQRGRVKSHESRRRKKSLKQLCRMVADIGAPGEIRDVMRALGIPEDDQTILLGIVLTAGLDGMKGDKDARRDFIRYLGVDPGEVREEKALALKEKEAKKKDPENDGELTIFEQMVRERHERAHEETS